MPEIGRPQGPNPFADVKMGQQKATTERTGNVLNKLANNGQDDRGVKFVDRTKHNIMGKNEFMKLLTYQMANQDPLNPVDQKKFTADMAQFAQLEQLANMNTKMEELSKNSPSESKFYGASFIGKEITTSGTSVVYDGQARSVDIPVFLEKDAKAVIVNIFDKQNQLIGKIEKENVGRGNQVITWDGLALDKATANKGEYRVDVKAFDKEFQGFAGQTKSSGLVTGVYFENGETILEVDGKKRVFLRDVENFKLHRQNKEAIAKYQQVDEARTQ